MTSLQRSVFLVVAKKDLHMESYIVIITPIEIHIFHLKCEKIDASSYLQSSLSSKYWWREYWSSFFEIILEVSICQLAIDWSRAVRF